MDLDANFFPCSTLHAVVVPSRAVDFFAHLGTRTASSIANQVAAISCLAPPHSDQQRTATRGGPVLAMESLATSIGYGWRHVKGREGFCRDRWSIYDAKKSPDQGPGDTRDRAFAKPSAA